MDINFIRRAYLAGFFILFIALFYYQIAKGDYYLERARNNYVKVIPLRSLRGNILDRNGEPIAYDRSAFNIAVIPYQIRNKQVKLFQELASELNIDEASLYKNYKKRKTNLFSPVDIVLDLDKKTAFSLLSKFGDDLLVNPTPQRQYPYAYEFAHVLGYVQEANALSQSYKEYGYKPLERVGFFGIERYYDQYLRGEDGGDLIEVDAGGGVVGYLGERKPKKGHDITLTIDAQIQRIAYQILGNRNGTIMLMDSQTGAIIAFVSHPSFDPNAFITGKNVNDFLQDKNKPLLNRAIQSTYSLGSTFKPMLALGSLEEKKSTAYTKFNCTGALRVGKSRFKCWSTHYEEDLYEAITHSCNVYFYNLGLNLGAEGLTKWAKRFGLDSPTNIDLPFEAKGFVPSVAWKKKKFKDNWYAGDSLNFSIGQGFFEATPLEVMVAINVFATDGYLVRPYFFKEVETIPLASRRIELEVFKKNLFIVRKAMSYVISKEDGTSKLLNKLDLGIAGKTGTAQTKGLAHGWFVGFFPYDKPKYTICVLIEHAGSSHVSVKAAYGFLSLLKQKKLL